MIEIEALGWVVSIDPTAVLAPGMFLALVVALRSGFPVAFCLGGIGVIFALLGMLSGEIEPQFVTALPQRILGIMANFTLLAIPAFVFMGAMLESSGIAERLLDTMGRLLGGCGAAWPWRSFWWVPCWLRPPAWWRPPSPPWA